MQHPELLRRIAPCGLDCGRCLDNPESPIARHAGALKEDLGGFAKRAAMFAGFDPAFAAYADFERVLDRLAAGSCRGCRAGECLFAACRVKDCVRERGLDFCSDCPEFDACDPGLSPTLARRWRENNRLLHTLGLSAYADWLAGQPRY